ncbi:MAG: hypothetical protein ACOY4K_09560 [Pseudomonadota bacterium]
MRGASLPAMFAVGILLTAGAPVRAQPAPGAAPPPAEPTAVEALVVTAPPDPGVDAIKAFVGEVSAPTPSGRYARWDRTICPGVIGMKPDFARRLNDRIAAAALAVGLQVGEPGCKSNMIVVATSDSQALAAEVVKDNTTAFGKWDDGATRGRKALKDFVETPRPVRWWHVSRPMLADGSTYQQGESVRVRQLGRVRATTRETFDHVVIIVDVSRIGVIRFDALADYVAMVGLAQIEPDADPEGVSTILNLFNDRAAGRPPADSLTAWDLAYLRALYASRAEAIRGERQAGDIARGMGEQLGAPKAGDGGEREE